MNSSNSARGARAQLRLNWPVRVFRLGEEPRPDPAAGTPGGRLAMMWPLALEAWSLAGRTLPIYDRAHTPVSVRRLDLRVDP